jgi:hypothetical protein
MTDHTPPTEPLDLDAIEARANAATDGPWERYAKYGPDFFANTSGEYLRGVGTFNFGDGEDAAADEEFVKHAVQDVRMLLAEVRRLRAANSESAIRDACACRGVVHADDCEVYLELLRTSEPTPEPPFEGLADRWEQLAEQGDEAIGHFEGPAAVTLNAEVEERGRVYRQAAADLREALATGRIPHDLMTQAERPAAVPAAVETDA